MRPHRRPEILAPAGDQAALTAAIRAGADAVYFGLHGFNARARAANFDQGSLAATLDRLHRHGVRGYVTLNTLVFDDELPALESAARACARAGADAVIVQDLGVARLVRAVAPTLPIHASTQMTCTDAGAVELARELGATRVILARELSLTDIAAIRASTDMELEVFVHGALCIAYSGQCLTSEAIGGRSANRGACAQACRLPYDLLVDGKARDLGDHAYLLSPEDMETSALVPQLIELGITSLKIEGRLKAPEYVAATTRLYRAAIDAAMEQSDNPSIHDLRQSALQTFSRGSGPGFFEGVNHQRLVEGRGCDHRGILAGECLGISSVRGRNHLRMKLATPISRGDGILLEGARAGEGEIGGRVWSILIGEDNASDVERAEPGTIALLWLGPDRAIETIPGTSVLHRRVWKTSDPQNERSINSEIESSPHRLSLNIGVSGNLDTAPLFIATTESGLSVEITGDTPLTAARDTGNIESALKEKLSRLGDTPYVLSELNLDLPANSLLPPSSINRARRSLVEKLLAASRREHATTEINSAQLITAATPPDREAPPAGLYVLCRTQTQAEAAITAGADGVYLDFLELTGTGNAVRALRSEYPKVHITLAPPRIRKPGEDKIDRYLASLLPDAILVRGLGALHESNEHRVHGEIGHPKIPRIGDFSLNVTNRLTAAEVLAHDLAAFTPSFDLDSAQLLALLDSPFARFAELVVHHPMPLFHMEHCVIAALLSTGRDHLTCGRPCEQHQISLRDRAGMVHPVEADVGCRNTVFHAAAQSAATLVAGAQKRGVRRFRVELVRESASETRSVVGAYRALIEKRSSPADLFRALKTESNYGVVKGSLRVLSA